MSLYDDLDVTPGANSGGVGGGSAASGWSLPMQKTLLLQQQKRLQQQQQQQAASGGSGSASSGPTLAPVLNLRGKQRDSRHGVIVGNLGSGVGGGEYRFNQRTGRMERAEPVAGVAKSIANDPTLSLGPDDNYNPFYPNEYDEVIGMIRAKRKMQELADNEKQIKQKQQKQQQKQQQQQQQQQPQRQSGHDSDGSFDRSGSDTDEEEDKKRQMGRGAYIAPPSSLVEQDSKLPPVDQSSSSAQYPPFGKQSLAEKHNVSSAAAKMMAKMGYRHGQGLGREGQGMASALSVEKTSKRGGKIVSELDRYKNPSLVIMLTNMVGPGEVDDELEDEIKDECQKYGPVVLVTIFEFQRPNIPPEEAVRIFVEFERMDSAIKAMNELNGRFFGGRTVTCRFYDTEKFRDLELEGQPMPLELNE